MKISLGVTFGFGSILLGALPALGTPQLPPLTTGEEGCANLVIRPCDDCENASAEDPDVVQAATLTGWVNSGAAATAFGGYSNGMAGGRVYANLEYYHRVVDFAVAYGGESCQTCGSTPATKGLRTAIESNFSLQHARTFRSRLWKSITGFGQRWTYNYDIQLDLSPTPLYTNATLTFPSGMYWKWIDVDNNGVFVEQGSLAKETTKATLVIVPGGYLVTTKYGEKLHFVAMDDDPSVDFRPDYLENKNGFRLTLAYDALVDGIDRLETVTDSFGRTLTYEWGLLGPAQHVIQKVTLPDAREILYTFTGPDDYTVTYANGDVSSYAKQFDPVDGTYYAFHDAKGHAGSRKHQVFTSASGQVRLIKDLDGNVLYQARWLDPNHIQHESITGLVETYTITDIGYPTEMVVQGTGATRSTSWEPLSSLVLSETDYLGNTKSYAYTDNELAEITSPDGSIVRLEYTGALRTSYTDPLGRVHGYAYDAKGNLIRHTYPDGSFEEWTVNAYGQTLTYQNRNGFVTVAAYDGFGNLIQVTLPDDDGLPGNNPVWTFVCDVAGKRLSQTDPMGRVTTFEYDLLDRMVKETFPDGTTRMSVYGTNSVNPADPAGTTTLIVGAKDRNDNWTTFTYDKLDNLLTQTDALGNYLTNTYVPGTDLLATQNREGDLTWHTYDGQGRLATSNVEANGSQVLTMNYEYDDLDRVVKSIDPYGFEQTKTFDLEGRLVAESKEYETGSAAVTSYTYDAVGNRITRVDPRGETWLYDFDVNDRMARSVDPLGAEVLFTYDPEGNRLARSEQIETARYGTSAWTYTARNQVATELDPTGVLVTYGYHLDDNLARVEKPATGGLTTFDYSCCGRLISRTVFVDGGLKDMTENYAYDGEGNRTARVDGEGFLWKTIFDVRDREVRRIDPLGKEVKIRYFVDGSSFEPSLDPGQGSAVKTIDANGHATTTVYDSAGRIVAQLDAVDNPTRTSFDLLAAGLVGTSTTDRNGGVTSTWSDGLGRLVNEVDELGNVTTHSYDLNGNELTVTDANGNTTSYAYDASNREVQKQFADGGTQTTAYFLNGWVASRTDPNGSTKLLVQDDAGRLLRVQYPDASEDVFAYDAGGRMILATTGLYLTGFPVARTYDAADRLVAETQVGKALLFDYDRRSLKTTRMMPDGIPVTFGYTSRGELQTIFALGKTYAGLLYDPAGRLVQKVLGNGTTTTLTYAQENWLTQISHAKGTTDLGTLAYAYDAEGRKLVEEDVTFPEWSQSFAYDPANRLVGWERGPLLGPGLETQSWMLDALGNWDSTTVDGLLTACLHGVVNELKTLGTTGFTYDANGNLIDDGTYTYEWDFNDRLRAVRWISDGSLAAQYAYDALGRRAARIDYTTPEDRFYIYDGNQVVREYTLGFQHVATYLAGNYIDEPLVRIGKSTHYYHTNGLYSPALLTDGTGAVVERYAYDAYGEGTTYDALWADPLAASRVGNPYLFTGRRLDPETGLLYFRARMYSPLQGRFVSRDPLGYVDGMNLYRAYFVPNGTDPTGQSPICGCTDILPKYAKGRPSPAGCQSGADIPTVVDGYIGVGGVSNCIQIVDVPDAGCKKCIGLCTATVTWRCSAFHGDTPGTWTYGWRPVFAYVKFCIFAVPVRLP